MARGVALTRKLKKEMKSHGKDYWMTPGNENAIHSSKSHRKTSTFVAMARSAAPPLIRVFSMCIVALLLSIPFISRDHAVNAYYDIPTERRLLTFEGQEDVQVEISVAIQLALKSFHYGGQRFQPQFVIPG